MPSLPHLAPYRMRSPEMPHSISDRIHLQNTGTENGLQKAAHRVWPNLPPHETHHPALLKDSHTLFRSLHKLPSAPDPAHPEHLQSAPQLQWHSLETSIHVHPGSASHVFRAPLPRAHARALPLLHVHDHVLLSSLLRVLHLPYPRSRSGEAV